MKNVMTRFIIPVIVLITVAAVFQLIPGAGHRTHKVREEPATSSL